MKLSLLKEKSPYLLAMTLLAPRVLVSCLEKTGRQDYNSGPIRVLHLTIARFQNKNKRLQRISDENGPLTLLLRGVQQCY